MSSFESNSDLVSSKTLTDISIEFLSLGSCISFFFAIRPTQNINGCIFTYTASEDVARSLALSASRYLKHSKH